VTPRRIRYELRDESPAPNAGDTLESSRSWFLVLSCRAISTRDGARRFDLVVIRIDPYHLDPSTLDRMARGRIYSLRWNRRTRKRRISS
jgi:hypothetical protein